MTPDLLIKVLNDLEPGGSIKVNGLAVTRWTSGVGWTVGEPGRSAGSNSLPTIVRILSKVPHAN